MTAMAVAMQVLGGLHQLLALVQQVFHNANDNIHNAMQWHNVRGNIIAPARTCSSSVIPSISALVFLAASLGVSASAVPIT